MKINSNHVDLFLTNQNKDFKNSRQLVLGHILRTCIKGAKGRHLDYMFYQSQTSVAKQTAKCERTIRYTENVLVEHGWLTREFRRHPMDPMKVQRVLRLSDMLKTRLLDYVNPKKSNDLRTGKNCLPRPAKISGDAMVQTKQLKTPINGGGNTRSDMIPPKPPPSKKVSSQVVAAARILETLFGWKKHDFRAFNSDVEAFLVDRGSEAMVEFQKWISGQPRAFGKTYTPEKWQDLIDRFDGKCQDDEVVDIEVSDEILAEMNERQQLQNQRAANGAW